MVSRTTWSSIPTVGERKTIMFPQMPELFEFSKEELSIMSDMPSEGTSKLLPNWVRERQKNAATKS